MKSNLIVALNAIEKHDVELATVGGILDDVIKARAGLAQSKKDIYITYVRATQKERDMLTALQKDSQKMLQSFKDLGIKPEYNGNDITQILNDLSNRAILKDESDFVKKLQSL